MKEKLNNALNNIDQRFIEEAARAGHAGKRAPKIIAASIGTAAAAAAVAAVCVLAANKTDPGVDLIQPPVSSAADALTWEDSSAAAEESTDSADAEASDHSGVFSCDKHDHTAVTAGADVPAQAGGVVVYTGELPNYGNTLIVRESDGSERMYCHLSGFALEPDDTVQEGETIGMAGCPDGSEQPVEAVMLADNDILGSILEMIRQSDEIRTVLEDHGVNESYDQNEAERIIRGGILPLHTETLQDRNTSAGWQSRELCGSDFYSEEMTAGVPVEVHSYQDGTVIAAKNGWNGGLGSYIVIDHGYGAATVYANLGEITVSEGETVKCGDVVAMTGRSGFVGYQYDLLHFEILVNGAAYDDPHTHKTDILEYDPDILDESIKAVCKEGSSYSAARAQELIRSSTMPLDDESMLVTKENGYDKWTGAVHYGVDLSDGESSTVYAYQSGTVLRAADSGWNSGLGSYIIIDHGSGLVTVYGCLDRVDVTEGQQVERGEVIGESGSTGYSSGVHLHFEIRENGVISTAMGSFTGDSHTHKWVSEGTKVYSSVSGDVWLVGVEPDMGNIVVIHGDDDRFTMYSHCGEVLVLPGDEVSAGDRIAIAGKPYGSDMTVIAEEEITDDMFTYYSAACVEGEFRQQEVDFIWPVGGEDGGVITELMYGYGGYYAHKGIDISAPKGTDVFAAESGTVIKAGWYDGYGNCVMIDHGGGLVTLYGHLDGISATEGQEVLAGEYIGSTGSTGNVTGYKLHFEVRRNGENVNPIPYLPWHQTDL